MGWATARPRVIRGTRTAPLPLLPSGPGGVCSRPLHGARDLTSIHRSMGAHGGCLSQNTTRWPLDSGRCSSGGPPHHCYCLSRVFSSTFPAALLVPCFTSFAACFVVLAVALPVFFAALPTSLPASFTFLPACLTSSFAVCAKLMAIPAPVHNTAI